jgi:alpha-galactosidase
MHIVPTTRPEDMSQMRIWSERFFTNAADIPISYVLDGKATRGIPSDWRPVSTRRRIDANIAETVFEGSDPGSGLNIRVECSEYLDYPVVEWVAWFTNNGRAPTPVLSDILALDGAFSGAAPVLDHCNGDFQSAGGYTPQENPVNSGDALAFAPSGGRSCDSAFPYYRLRFKDWGLTLAIGWPAQWSVCFAGVTNGAHVQAGQEKTHLRLMPGETIRTPRMTVLTWAGDESRAVNLWRRWYLAHILPRPDGRPMRPLLACAATDEGEEFTSATEDNQIRYIDAFRQRGIHPDVWWIDAGWYPCDPADNTPSSAKMPDWCSKWWNTGNWQPDPKRFPRGLKPISDRAAQGGADLLLWFEPERVWPGSRLDNEHPEWLLKIAAQGEPWMSWKTYDNALLNLGHPACRQWLTDHVCKLIQDNGVRIYRQDHNFPPLQHWRQNEAPDRQGMNENLHVQGYLQYWDDLLARNPGLWIDSCASGGRRNDLETMRRSVPLHYTDHGYGDAPVKLAFHRTLYEWIPYFKEFTLAWDLKGNARFDHQVDSYSFHCGMAPMLFATLDIRRDDYDFELAQKMIAIWRRAAGLMLHGDYYPLTPFHRSAEKWVVRQFDCPERGRGLIQGIRLPASEGETLTVHPRGIRSGVVYRFENAETGDKRELSADALIRDGFTFALPPRSGAIWFYASENE